ncbi:MAG TPA: hypothetical protein VLM89_16870 [Phycisphaerae bacterium]|nr:hypothetical protein [Phycisphaerae bacterium]
MNLREKELRPSLPTVYKPTVTRPMPAEAELFEQDGRPHARWRDGRGRLRTAPVVVPDKGPYAGQQRIALESDRYVVRYRDAEGVVRTASTDCRDERQARQLLEQLVSQAAASCPKPAAAGGERRPIAFRDHFREYLQDLKGRGAPTARLADIERQVRRLARQCGFVRLTDVESISVQRWALDRQADGMSAGACNAHLGHLTDFVEWCIRGRRLAENPLRGISLLGESGPVVSDARPLTEEELTRLLKIALWRPLAEYGRAPDDAVAPGAVGVAGRFVPVTIQTLEGLVSRGRQQLSANPVQIARLQRQGWQRALIYKVLGLVGLRRSELVALRMGSLHLKRSRSYLRLGMTGRGSGGTKIPLRVDLADDLRLWSRYRWRTMGKSYPDQDRAALKQAFLKMPLFKLPSGLAKLLAVDLQAAGIAQKDEQGVRIEVYAAREAQAAVLSRNGIPLAVLWSSMREASSGSGVAYTLKEGLLRALGLRSGMDEQPG